MKIWERIKQLLILDKEPLFYLCEYCKMCKYSREVHDYPSFSSGKSYGCLLTGRTHVERECENMRCEDFCRKY